MLGLLAALLAGAGVFVLIRPGSTTVGSTPLVPTLRNRVRDALVRAGIDGAHHSRLPGVVAAFFGAGTLIGWLMFGGFIAPACLGLFASSFPLATVRNKQRAISRESAQAWPRLIEQTRLLCGSLGKPIPQALIEVGRTAPAAMQPAFNAAEREWRSTTDFDRTAAVLKHRLADPTADIVCETLLVAHNLGGSDLQRRLRTLAEDRQSDLDARRDAVSKQAGVRFARNFVLIVPAGMALAGMSIGTGRAAYQSASGQLGLVVALATLALCWWWAGRLIKLPETQRVFRGE